MVTEVTLHGSPGTKYSSITRLAVIGPKLQKKIIDFATQHNINCEANGTSPSYKLVQSIRTDIDALSSNELPSQTLQDLFHAVRDINNLDTIPNERLETVEQQLKQVLELKEEASQNQSLNSQFRGILSRVNQIPMRTNHLLSKNRKDLAKLNNLTNGLLGENRLKNSNFMSRDIETIEQIFNLMEAVQERQEHIAQTERQNLINQTRSAFPQQEQRQAFFEAVANTQQAISSHRTDANLASLKEQLNNLSELLPKLATETASQKSIRNSLQFWGRSAQTVSAATQTPEKSSFQNKTTTPTETITTPRTSSTDYQSQLLDTLNSVLPQKLARRIASLASQSGIAIEKAKSYKTIFEQLFSAKFANRYNAVGFDERLQGFTDSLDITEEDKSKTIQAFQNSVQELKDNRTQARKIKNPQKLLTKINKIETQIEQKQLQLKEIVNRFGSSLKADMPPSSYAKSLEEAVQILERLTKLKAQLDSSQSILAAYETLTIELPEVNSISTENIQSKIKSLSEAYSTRNHQASRFEEFADKIAPKLLSRLDNLHSLNTALEQIANKHVFWQRGRQAPLPPIDSLQESINFIQEQTKKYSEIVKGSRTVAFGTEAQQQYIQSQVKEQFPKKELITLSRNIAYLLDQVEANYRTSDSQTEQPLNIEALNLEETLETQNSIIQSYQGSNNPSSSTITIGLPSIPLPSFSKSSGLSFSKRKDNNPSLISASLNLAKKAGPWVQGAAGIAATAIGINHFLVPKPPVTIYTEQHIPTSKIRENLELGQNNQLVQVLTPSVNSKGDLVIPQILDPLENQNTARNSISINCPQVNRKLFECNAFAPDNSVVFKITSTLSPKGLTSITIDPEEGYSEEFRAGIAYTDSEGTVETLITEESNEFKLSTEPETITFRGTNYPKTVINTDAFPNGVTSEYNDSLGIVNPTSIIFLTK